ncbi:MAG: L-seryl-tRNA(Sec) selenium transferase [Anaerolineae bacterium]
MQKELRKLPSVDQLLRLKAIQGLEKEHGHQVVVEAVRTAIEEARQAILSGEKAPARAALVEAVGKQVDRLVRPTLQPVINATGVIIHTNLGRAPLSQEAMAAMQEVGGGYSNLEYELEAGERGSRYIHAAELLRRLTGAEDALLVNNNASALLLILATLAEELEVIISRGELVEIGGRFRIPEIMAQSGAMLVEVGTTNRTYQWDYEEAITEATALLLRVHHSNFRMQGFVHQTPLAELVELGQEYGVPVVDDLGSGTLLDTATFGLAHEPMVQESVERGADLVCFSGDKLLGGPQAGIIVGRQRLIKRLKRHPLARALRVDKTTIAALQTTLLHYLQEEVTERIPVWQMIAASLPDIEARAEKWKRELKETGYHCQVVDGQSTVGGGSLPGETLPSKVLAIAVESPHELSHRLRQGSPPVVGRIEGELLLLDPRTVLPHQDELLMAALRQAST